MLVGCSLVLTPLLAKGHRPGLGQVRAGHKEVVLTHPEKGKVTVTQTRTIGEIAKKYLSSADRWKSLAQWNPLLHLKSSHQKIGAGVRLWIVPPRTAAVPHGPKKLALKESAPHHGVEHKTPGLGQRAVVAVGTIPERAPAGAVASSAVAPSSPGWAQAGEKKEGSASLPFQPRRTGRTPFKRRHRALHWLVSALLAFSLFLMLSSRRVRIWTSWRQARRAIKSETHERPVLKDPDENSRFEVTPLPQDEPKITWDSAHSTSDSKKG